MPKKQFRDAIPKSDKWPNTYGIVADALLRGPMFGAIDSDEVYDEKLLAFSLGSCSNINGRIYPQDGRTIASVDCFYVSKRLCRHGLGERLLKAFIVASIKNGAEELWSDAVSNQALGLRAKVFGEQALQFYDGETLEDGMLPITLEQARLTNARIDQLDDQNPDRSYPQPHIGVYVDLRSIDTTGWEDSEVVQIGHNQRQFFTADYCD